MESPSFDQLCNSNKKYFTSAYNCFHVGELKSFNRPIQRICCRIGTRISPTLNLCGFESAACECFKQSAVFSADCTYLSLKASFRTAPISYYYPPFIYWSIKEHANFATTFELRLISRRTCDIDHNTYLSRTVCQVYALNAYKTTLQ